jgi:hypothetical protein
MQAVPGVVAVDLNAFQRTDAAEGAPAVADRLAASVPSAGTEVTLPAELLVLDPRPVEPGVIAA